MPVCSADFNGDGIGDLLFRDRTGDDHRLRLVLNAANGSIQQKTIVLANTPGSDRGFDVRSADFNGDGRSDILSRDLVSGITRIRLMNGLKTLAAGRVTELPENPAVVLVTAADFNGDGRSDLLYRHRDTGVWSVYILNGLVVDRAASGATNATSWKWSRWVSSADFNGDGRADLLVRNSQTLKWMLYLMDGKTVRKSTRLVGAPVSPAWQIEAIADMNRDGRADLLLRHRDSGAWRSLFLDGGRVLESSGNIAINRNPAYQLQLLTDMNADGFPDAVLRRPDSGRWQIEYLMNLARLSDSGSPALGYSPKLRIADVADLNGDGYPEILAANGSKWMSYDLRNPGAPVVTPLKIGSPAKFPVVCDPPNYYQFGTPSKPATATSRSAFLTWIMPVTRANGEALCAHELAGYRIYYKGDSPITSFIAHIADGRTDAWLLDKLSPNRYSFRIRSYDYHGVSSKPSTTLFKDIY
ncbi:MAG: VCBS repeat-containing protein [Pseudomonadales bacterium]|nr:VCBS repeat-containing protein [Pseudomonadales bacterium]